MRVHRSRLRAVVGESVHAWRRIGGCMRACVHAHTCEGIKKREGERKRRGGEVGREGEGEGEGEGGGREDCEGVRRRGEGKSGEGVRERVRG
jgi:hypothetical protein